ncbi:Caffeic acid 3-O-methyltransferase [Capsicum chinense]|nr:Caffeic acid 3-O-methyltransferase [Capsicum chinense]
MGSTSHSLTQREDEAFVFAMQLASASVLAMVLKSALELDLLEIMAKAGQGAFISPCELATQLPSKNSETLPDGRVERLYSLTPVCKFLTKNGDGVSVAPLLLMNQDKVLMERWYHLTEAVLDGGVPFNKAYGMTAFEYHALPAANGKVIIAECILPEAPDTSAATKSKVHGDIIMFAHNSGGLEALAKGAGFRGFHKACCAYDTWIMEFNE